jgi:hypothetical protein
MEEVRSKIFRGKFMTSDGGRAETDPRRAGIAKGTYITSGGGPVKLSKVPDNVIHHTLGIAEIIRRLQMVRAALDADTMARRK